MVCFQSFILITGISYLIGEFDSVVNLLRNISSYRLLKLLIWAPLPVNHSNDLLKMYYFATIFSF